MACALKTVFWISAGVVIYAYAVYPLILFLLYLVREAKEDLRFLLTRKGRRFSDRQDFNPDELPRVSFLLAARNEEEILPRKLENFSGLTYPKERTELLVGSDASEDRTVEIARQAGDPRIRVFEYRERGGKIGVLKKLISEASGEILVLSDANTFFAPDALLKLVRHFRDPSVGAVCGELRLAAPDGTLASEGLYWRFETVLKTLESRFDAVLGANGGIYAVRRNLFPEIPPDTIVEDLVIPLMIRIRGYRTPFEPEAVAFERNPVDPHGEFKRRIRIGAGCLQAIHLLRPLLSFRFGMVSFAFWSHKIFRWAVPFAMILALLSDAFLLKSLRPGPAETLYAFLFAIQLLFYILAAAGALSHCRGKRQGALALPFMFVSLNAALLGGFFNYLSGRHRVAWERTKRIPGA